MTLSATLDAVPYEVIEQIAFITATDPFLGPPSNLIPLLLTNRKIYSWLSIHSNHHLYGRIFTHKFDVGSVARRLGSARTTSQILTTELQRRCSHLKRIRARLDSITPTEGDNSAYVRHVLLEAYFMLLENEGKNEKQLSDYAVMDRWLREYWFHEAGASRAVAFLRAEKWLPDTQERSLAMWLFWFMLRPGDFTKDDEASCEALHTVKTLALAAHKYVLTDLSWTDFLPQPRQHGSDPVVYYSKPCHFRFPPLGTPAILSFLTLANRLAVGVRQSTPLPPPRVAIPRGLDWECEWERCRLLGQTEYDKVLTESFTPGSIEGIWEGIFTYTEFTAYARLLNGGPPRSLQKSMVARHRQTWKLREHHLIASDLSRSDSGIEIDSDYIEPLAAGDPLRSYFPTGTQLREDPYGVEVCDPSHPDVLRYQRLSSTSDGEESRGSSVHDIIITGEGHSAWGQFSIIGRVRPYDGFISLSKEYVDGDRGKWIYRGYLVGNINGNLAGRWRDTLSPADDHGYEGCFAMSRRR